MKRNLLFKTMFLLCALVVGTSSSWAEEGDELAKCQGTGGTGYAYGRTLTDSHSVGWFLSMCQTGYFGANNATNHNKSKPSADDLPVVKAVKADATTSTTGYYFYYTTTAIANVGSLEFSYSDNSGNQSATAYVVVGDAKPASGGNTFEIIELAKSSTTAQGASLGSSGTFTYTFKEKQTSARYYGFIIVTSSYKRMGDATIKLLEGATITTPAIDAGNVNMYDDDTNGSIAYSINNPAGDGVLTAVRAIDADTWLTVGTPTPTAVPFTTTVNTGTERSTTVRLTYTYNTDKTVTKDVTVTQSAPVTKYNITILAPDNGTLVVKRGETTVYTDDKFPQGTVLNVTATPNEGYKFRNWQAVDNSTHTYTTSNIGTWTMTESDVTLKANFDPIPQYTYSWMVNGTEVKSETLYEDADVVFPPVADRGGKVFYGWVTTSTVDPNNEPALVGTLGVKASANITYYAVFADKEGDGVDTYEKLSSNEFDANATYVIGSMNGINLTLFYSYGDVVDSNASWGKMSTNYSTNPPLTFTLSGTASALYAKDNNGNYLQGDVNDFRMVSESHKAPVKLDNNGKIYNYNSGSESTRWLRYNTGAGYGLRWYGTGSSTGNLAYFYKVISGYIYSNYCTTIPTVNVTITDLSSVPGSTYAGKNYTTMYYSDKAFAVPTGVVAKTYKMEGGVLTESRTYENGGIYPIIPAGEAVVVESDVAADYSFVVSSTETTPDAENALCGTDATTTVDDAGYKYYKLALNNDKNKVGFFFAVTGGTSINNGAHKAYLRVATGAGAKNFYLFDDTATGINNVVISDESDDSTPMYNLAGQRVNKSYKGVVIQNGKKMFNK